MWPQNTSVSLLGLGREAEMRAGRQALASRDGLKGKGRQVGSLGGSGNRAYHQADFIV